MFVEFDIIVHEFPLSDYSAKYVKIVNGIADPCRLMHLIFYYSIIK